jgi:hypothetical protein
MAVTFRGNAADARFAFMIFSYSSTREIFRVPGNLPTVI